jgi:DNA-binding SARP family transcriptional activator
MVTTTQLSVRVLGELDLRLGETSVPPLESARAESLLTYLLLHRDAPVPRQRLAFLLWPDSTEAQARTNLRHVLHNLRRALPDSERFLEVTPRTLRWRPDAPLKLDIAVFEGALARAGDDDVDALREAAEAYTGDLLEGAYDAWLLEERERLRQSYLDALDRLARRLAKAGETAGAIVYAERLVRHDPLREPAYRLLMRLHDERGDRARALRAYHACAAALGRELGVEPAPPTRELYEALLPVGAPEADAGAPAPVLVGRSAERTRLTELWRDSERGRSQLVLVTGEAGIGKTRLVEELRSWCAHRGAATAEARSYPAEGALAYGPVAGWLRSDALAPRRVRLDRGRLAELARVLPEIAAPTAPRPEPLTEAEERQRLFGALAAALTASSAPLLLVADDLHWADRETLQFLHYLLRSAPESPLLVAATARSEEPSDALEELISALRTTDRFEQVELARLSREETALLAGADVDADRLFAETEGNPLFVVEALRAGWSGGPAPLSPRVQAVIESRLAQLSAPARALVDIAATIGRAFTVDLLASSTSASEADLVGGLDELWRRRIVADQGPDAYDFTHDKIREVAYRGLSPPRRRHAHLLVARALEALPGPVSGEIAVHYDRAGDAGEAVTWYARAGEAALELYASRDALRFLERALELVSDPARELALITAILPSFANVDGFGSLRLLELQRRALELGEEPDPVLLRSLAVGALTRGEFEEATGHGERLRERAERDGDDVLLVEGHYVLGISAFWRSDMHAARHHFEAAVDRYRVEHRATHVVRYGLDPQVVCMSRLANTLGFLGEREAAVATCERALELAGEIGHEPTRATALTFAALLALDLGDRDALRRHTAELRRCGSELRATSATGECLAGYFDVVDGRPEAGLARIRRVLQDVAEPGHAPGHRASLVRVFIEACALAGDHRGGLAATQLPLRVRLWEPERLAWRAEFLAALDAPAQEVEASARAAAAARNARGTPRPASSPP